MISSMTGGTEKAQEINRILAGSAQKFNIAIGVGSQRIGIEQDWRMETFDIRKYAPDVLLFANLGAVQLRNTFTIDDCKKAVEAIGADALIFHLNPLQEALMEDEVPALIKTIEGINPEGSGPTKAKKLKLKD